MMDTQKLEQALEMARCADAEPRGEPVAWNMESLIDHPPQQRKPLTKVQITELAEQCGYDGAVPTVRLAFQGFKLDDFARAIERAHGIVEAP